jgi:hypothetical protein
MVGKVVNSGIVAPASYFSIGEREVLRKPPLAILPNRKKAVLGTNRWINFLITKNHTEIENQKKTKILLRCDFTNE